MVKQPKRSCVVWILNLSRVWKGNNHNVSRPHGRFAWRVDRNCQISQSNSYIYLHRGARIYVTLKPKILSLFVQTTLLVFQQRYQNLPETPQGFHCYLFSWICTDIANPLIILYTRRENVTKRDVNCRQRFSSPLIPDHFYSLPHFPP